MLHFDGVNERYIRIYIVRFALRRTSLLFQITSSLSICHLKLMVISLVYWLISAGGAVHHRVSVLPHSIGRATNNCYYTVCANWIWLKLHKTISLIPYSDTILMKFQCGRNYAMNSTNLLRFSLILTLYYWFKSRYFRSLLAHLHYAPHENSR
jgi:hypothetical protein